MTYVVPAGFSRVSFDFEPISTAGSAPSFGFGLDRPPSEDLLDALQLWWEDSYRDLCNQDAILKRITARSDVGFVERLLNDPGQATGTFSGPQISALISLATGLAGRANRGRIYLPFVIDDPTLDAYGRISDSLRLALVTLIQGLNTALDPTGASLVILHSTSSDPTPVTTVTPQTQSATQRRRNRR